MIAIFENLKGEQFEIDIPISVSELCFEDFIDFQNAEQEFFKDNMDIDGADVDSEKIEEEESPKEKTLNVPMLLDCLSYVIKGDLSKFDYNIEQEELDYIFDTSWVIGNDLGKVTDITIYHLYAHIVNMVNSYEPKELLKDFTYNWQKVDYVIQQEDALAYMMGAALTSGEVISVLEFQRLAAKQGERKGVNQHNIDFNLSLEECAVLMRPKGFRLPFNERQRISYIDTQKEVFRKLPYDVVLNVRFFFINILLQYMETHVTIFSLTHQDVSEKQVSKGSRLVKVLKKVN